MHDILSSMLTAAAVIILKLNPVTTPVLKSARCVLTCARFIIETSMFGTCCCCCCCACPYPPHAGGAFNTKRATATTSLESPTIPPGVLNCAQLLSLGKTRNIKVGPAPNRAAGYPATVCSLTRTNVRGSILLSAASLAAVGAAEAHANTTYGITSLVVYYSEKGAGSSIVVTPNARGRSTAISSSNITLAAATAGVWSPKKVLAPLPSLAHNVTIELSPFPAGAAVQLVSVEFSIAAVPEQPMPSGMLKGYKPSAGLASTTVLQQLKEFSSNDLYNGSYGGPGSASDVSAQMLMLPSLIVAVSGVCS
jgi:hypothetical protein